MPLRFGGRQLSITASGGLADFLTGETERELVRRADEALYASKKAGRKCAHYNDGRTNHLVQPGHIQSMLPAAAASEKVGDEWLFDTEGLVDTLQKEPIPQISERPAFFDDLIRRISQWRRGGAPLALLLVQVDAFGRIHSDHGPTAADVVLRVAAQLINALMRDMDHVARLGDDTFALILPGALLNDGLAIGERLRQAVERCRLPRKAGTGWFTVSVGVVEASEGDDLRRILERAREALGNAANQGRNCVIGHDAEGQAVQAVELAV
jgi:diguanylate cyclase